MVYLLLFFLACLNFYTETLADVPYAVAYCDFPPSPFRAVVGRVTFTQYQDETTTVTGQCNTGFNDSDPSHYRWTISLYYDLTPFVDYSVNSPGTSAFQARVDDLPLTGEESVVGTRMRVFHNDEVIGRCDITRIG
ncbi:10316_t:CDS:1 [Paraglomus brasilianum]|uniref:10316_t:CDS:1 n=1 Tax=Paraglomus brasilianum TaxID=144538 RepID=A0A9N9CMQ7_9GLOM|nr:10316_t:CDS:1 [Paraglomus brasilianum]